ncbi:MAG TPA: GNAT family N-acetyltransferase [Thermoplasmata archaeon]|nr:GNAT family N-acetyltransferase [Thermoplasmata archaeon]
MATNHRAEKGEKAAEAPPAPPPAAPAPHPIIVERLTHQDVPEICNLFRRVWEPYLAGLPAEVQRAWQPTPLEFTSGMEGVTYFSARRDGKLIGVVGCELVDGACHLLNLCVEADQRRHGVGTALLQAALEWARHAGAKSLFADILPRFPDAALLLSQQQFAEAGTLHRHFWGEDVRQFERLL